MTLFLAPLSVLAFITAEAEHASENAVVYSNWALVAATIIMTLVTIREAHRTVREVVKDENSTLVKVVRALVRPGNGNHRAGDE